MGLSNLVVSQRYTPNGSNDTFAIPFQFIEGDVNVIKVYEIDTDTGVKTLKTEGALNDYTLDDATNPANVVYNTAPAASVGKVSIERLLPLKQLTDYINSGRFIAESHETQLDKVVMMVQQIDEMYQRALKANLLDLDASFDFDLPILTGEGGKLFRINDDGDGIELIAPDDLDLRATAGEDTIAEGQAATDVTDMTVDRTLHSSAVFTVEIKRGTTVMSKKEIVLLDLNGVWTLCEGAEIAAGVLSGLTWTVTEAGGVAQVQVAIGADSLGNGTLKWVKVGIDA